MSRKQSKLEDLQLAIRQGQLSRRDVLRRALALGLSAPVIAGLLAACGGDDDDTEDTATEPEPTEPAGGEATEAMTEGATEAATAEESDEGTAAATEAGTEEPTEEGTAEAGSEGGEEQTFEGGDRLMGKEIEEAVSAGGTLIEGSELAVSTLSPILRNDGPSYAVISMIYERLFDTHPDTLEPIGNLAETWSVAEDGLTWTINLRQGVTWQDGEPFTAEDVKFTYDLMMTEEANSPRFSELTGLLESVEVVDELTVQFTTKGVLADFELGVAGSSYFIIPRHLWQDVAPADIQNDPGSTGQDPARVVGTGPFVFQEWVVEDRVVCARNENYWDGAPHLDQYIRRYLGSDTAVLQALQTGEIDFGSIPEAQVTQLEGTDVAVYNFSTLSFTFYGTNLDAEKTTLFQEPEVRKALLYALDREAVVESILFGYGQVAVGTMPVLSWAYNPEGIDESNLYPYDVDLANQLLDDAGWTMGDDGVRQKEGQRLAFIMHSSGELRRAYLTAFQEFWREIGVEMTPQIEPLPALVERITETFDFEVFLVGFGWDATPDQSPMWACDSYPLGFNIVKYCNPEVDALLDEALHTLDREQRIELYTDFQNVLLQDLPMAVLDFPEELQGVNNRVHNLFPSAGGTSRFNPETWWIDQ